MPVRSQYDGLIGSTLDVDLFDDDGTLVLRAGTLITENLVAKLSKHRISHLPIIGPMRYRQTLSEALGYIRDLFDGVKTENRVDMEIVQHEIVPRILDSTAHPELNELLVLLEAKDKYSVSHSLAVSVLASLLGKWLDMDATTLEQLATAAALHDVGKAKIPDTILSKPGQLTREEYEIVKTHTTLGYRLVKATKGATEAQALAALLHHERFDGSGYPMGLQGEKISLFARIISVADVFHAMSSSRVYQKAKPMYRILSEMDEGMYGQFDARILRVFLIRMMENLIGSQVELSDGQVATIRMIHHTNPTLPLLQTAAGFVDLNQDPSVRILRLRANECSHRAEAPTLD